MSKRAATGLASGLFAALLATASTGAPATTSTTVPMKKDGGVYVVPVSVNGAIIVDCIVDSGASDVNIPADAFEDMVRQGLVDDSDYLGTRVYTLANGASERGRIVRIRALKVGNVVVHNVTASVGADDSTALLGQSFLERFRSWSLDNAHHALVLVGPPSDAPHPPAVARRHPDGAPQVAGGSDREPESATVAQVSGGHGRPSGAHPARPHRPLTADDGSPLTAQDGR
jgi:clan AA aspartic protease (TIGR02281 family)